jgi:hypothetical protein
MTPCDQVAERLAIGEPLGDGLDAHVATCPACARLTSVPALVARAARADEPAPGFSVRITAGARRRIAVRRRNRVALLAAAAACVLLAGGTAALRQPEQPLVGAFSPLTEFSPIDTPTREQPTADAPTTTDAELAAALARLADVDASLRPAADWNRIQAPVAPYGAVLDSIRSPSKGTLR